MNDSVAHVFYRIGYVQAENAEPHDSYTPIEIYISSVYREKLFIYLQGRGYGLMGGEFSVKDAQKIYNKEIFSKCGCEWALNISESNFDELKIKSTIIEKTGGLIEKKFNC